MVRGKQGAWCRSKDPQPSEARRSGSRKANLWAVALNCVLKRHGLGRGLRPMWKAALSDVRCHWVLVSRRRSLSCARNHLTDPGPRFGMLANVSSVVSRRSPILYSPANFTACRISFGRSGPRSNILQPNHLAFFSAPTLQAGVFGARGSDKAALSSCTADVHHIAIALGCIRIDKSRYQQPTINGNDFAILFATSRSGWTGYSFSRLDCLLAADLVARPRRQGA